MFPRSILLLACGAIALGGCGGKVGVPGQGDEGGGGGEPGTTSTGSASGGAGPTSGSGATGGSTGGTGGSVCKPELSECKEDFECCSGDCLYGQKCAPPLCREAGEPCKEPVDCCSQVCDNGVCAVEDGTCKPGVGPVAFAVHLDAPGTIAVDSEAVYFSDTTGGTLSRRSFTSGPVEVLAENGSIITAIVPLDQHVFWTQDTGVNNGGGLHRTSKLTGQTELWMSGPARGLAAGKQDVYAVVDTVLYRFPLAGGAPESLVSGLQTLTLSIDDSHLYWTDHEKGELWRLPLPNGAPELLADGLKEPVRAVTNGSTVAWADWSTFRIQRFELPNGPVENVVTLMGMPRGPVWSLSDGALYFAHVGGDNTGAIWKLPKGADDLQVVATEVTPYTVDLKLSETCVYFTDVDNHSVKRVAR